MMFLPLIIIGLILWAVWYRDRDNHSSSIYRNEKRSPLDIARERYARGEITKEQFEQMKKDLA
jgi:putative membrane protein